LFPVQPSPNMNSSHCLVSGLKDHRDSSSFTRGGQGSDTNGLASQGLCKHASHASQLQAGEPWRVALHAWAPQQAGTFNGIEVKPTTSMATSG
jgi:hypothetical protein